MRQSVAEQKTATVRLQRELEAVPVRDGAGRVRNKQEHRRLAAVRRLARAREREANARRDYAHKVSRQIVDGADVIALEKLQLRAMTRSAKGSTDRPGRNVRAKSALNRLILDSGFGLLWQMIAAKAEEAARAVVEVDARFSSQECSRCGHVSEREPAKKALLLRGMRVWCACRCQCCAGDSSASAVGAQECARSGRGRRSPRSRCRGVGTHNENSWKSWRRSQPQAEAMFCEDSSNGIAVIQTLEQEMTLPFIA